MYTKLNIYKYDCDCCPATARVEAESPTLPKDWTTRITLLEAGSEAKVARDMCLDCSKLALNAENLSSFIGKPLGDAIMEIQALGFIARLRFDGDNALPRSLKNVDVWNGEDGKVTRIEH